MSQTDISAFSIQKLSQTMGFWSALAGAFAGAITAFALGSFGKWRAAANAKRAAGNLAIFTLADMYSEAKVMHEAVFVAQRTELERLLRREPRYFEYRPVMDLRTQLPSLDVEGLGFLVDSTDPDILMRLLVARNDFATMLRVADVHEKLHLEHQRQVAQSDHRGKIPYRIEEISAVSRPDLIAQLEATIQTLEARLQELVEALPKLMEDLRTVLSYVLPTRSFLEFIPGDRGRLSQGRSIAVKPVLWRRAARYVRRLWDRILGVRWRIPTSKGIHVVNSHNENGKRIEKFSDANPVMLMLISFASTFMSVEIGFEVLRILVPMLIKDDQSASAGRFWLSGVGANLEVCVLAVIVWFTGALAARCNKILMEQWFP